MNPKQVASRNNDVQLADFVESEFLGEQVSKFHWIILAFILCSCTIGFTLILVSILIVIKG